MEAFWSQIKNSGRRRPGLGSLGAAALIASRCLPQMQPCGHGAVSCSAEEQGCGGPRGPEQGKHDLVTLPCNVGSPQKQWHVGTCFHVRIPFLNQSSGRSDKGVIWAELWGIVK